MSPVTFLDGGDGEAYATASQVAGRDRGFTFTATSKPSIGDLDDFLTQSAAELDGILRARGYQLPIPTTATQALELLQSYNITGAIALMQLSAPTGGGKRDDALKLWAQCKRMLASGEVMLDTPSDTQTALPRYGGSPTAMFDRYMDL